MRAYMAKYYQGYYCKGGPNAGQSCTLSQGCPDSECDYPFEVLSLTTLSTPHNGSVAADIAVGQQNARKAKLAAFDNFPSFAGVAFSLKGNLNYESLQTLVCAGFNRTNIKALKSSRRASRVAYYTIAADLDKNLNEEADGFECAELLLEEYAEWHGGNIPPPVGAPLFNAAYQTLKSTRYVDIALPAWWHIGTLHAYRDDIPRWNDIMVTMESGAGRGPGGFEYLVTDYEEFGLLPNRGRNHASVVNQDSAIQVINWMRAVERARGDLR